jgi:membrane protease YdiL (CAAX protease family)
MMSQGSTAPSDRSTALRHALLFIVATSPIWFISKRFPVLQPVSILGVLLGVTLLFLWWDKRPASDLGLGPSWRTPVYLLGGMLGGLLFIGVIAALLYVMLPFEWARNSAFLPRAAATSLGVLLIGGAVEELLFRGYAFERLIVSIGLWPAQAIAALLFAAYHMANGWTWQSAFIGPIFGALLFGLVFARTRSVLASSGFHAAGNWARDLALLDPPMAKTWFGPVANRAWTPMERQSTLIIFNGVAVVGCVLLYWSIRRRDRKLAAGDMRAGTPRAERALAK